MKLLATLVLCLHVLWIAFVIFGALWTRGRRFWTGLHLLALVWGILVELGPWPCPLTLAELYLETRAGLQPYQGGFLIHSLSSVVYPNLPDWLITVLGVAVCVFNLSIYIWRLSRWLRTRRRARQGL